MPGITDPSEEYFKDGLWAWVTDQWKKLVADASNFLQVNIAAQDIDVEVKQATAADLTPGACGWDGSVWHKLAMVWGYSDRYVEKVVENNVSAGNIDVDLGTVPAGEVWVVRDVSMIGQQSNYTLATLSIRVASVTYYLTIQANPGAWMTAEFHGNVTLKADDYLRATFNGALDGDDFLVVASGYKMKVAE